MTKKALIIIVPGHENTKGFLPGTKVDLQNYSRYLKSSAGGKWDTNEFEYLVNPTGNQIKQKVQSIYSHYSFVVFSGHGGINRYNNRFYIDAIDGSLDAIYLKTNADKQLVIFDTCRSYYFEDISDSNYSNFEGKILEGSPLVANIGKESFLNKGIRMQLYSKNLEKFHAKLVLNSKKLFDDYISICDTGIIQLYSSSIGQASGDDPKKGGYYSSSLIIGGYKWNHQNANNQHILDIFDANELAQKIMSELYFTNQKSEILGGRRRFWFPFAIR